MAITNYSELQAAIIGWHKRDPGVIPDCITLAEKRINADMSMRLAEVEVTLPSVAGSRYIPLPDLVIKPIALWRDYPSGTRQPIQFELAEIMGSDMNSAGLPSYYALDGGNIAFECPNAGVYNYIFRYKKGFDIKATVTNDLLDDYPGLYLYGSLIHAALHARDRTDVEYWQAMYTQELDAARLAEAQAKTNVTLSYDNSGGSCCGSSSTVLDGGF